ncbi:ABC transporter ATP-binding protein [Corynebacterium kroppenstedtii]|uniref:ABC transporter ATP-binding protein n=1 Tax=Corynebacterium sp. PCR 32 TaxID=3351342 RepID=UPI0030A43F0A
MASVHVDTSPSVSTTHKKADTTTAHYSDKRRMSQAALKELITPVQKQLLLCRVITVASCIIAVAPYVTLTHIGNLLLNEGSHRDITRSVMILAYAFIAQACLYTLALTISHFADLRLRNRIQHDMVTTLAHAPLSWFSETSTGKVRKAITDDVKQVHTLVAHAPVEQTAAMAGPLILLIYAFVVDWRLGLLSISTFPIYGVLQAAMMRGMGNKTAEMDEKLGDMSSAAIELSEGISVVKNFERAGTTHARFTQACKDFATFYWAWCGPLIRASALSLSFISMSTLMTITIGCGLLMAHAGWVTVPEVLTCSLIGLVLPRAVEVLGSTAWSYQQGGNAALRLKDVLDTEQIHYPEETTASTASQRAHGTKDIVFSNVSFAYTTSDGTVDALRGINLRLRPNSVTALVGPSGSGKTTLATMLARFCDPDSGTITIGGIPLTNLTERELYSTVSFVLQNPYLQDLPIRDVIALSRPDATTEEIRNAARQANILDDIDALPHGFDTVLGVDTTLSGGQQQRLAIARALLVDAPILVLDEATTATDPDCEAEIQRALATLAQGRTVLAIGHHAESVAGADHICIMERGRIVAQGTADELADQPFWKHLTEGVHQ